MAGTVRARPRLGAESSATAARVDRDRGQTSRRSRRRAAMARKPSGWWRVMLVTKSASPAPRRRRTWCANPPRRAARRRRSAIAEGEAIALAPDAERAARRCTHWLVTRDAGQVGMAAIAASARDPPKESRRGEGGRRPRGRRGRPTVDVSAGDVSVKGGGNAGSGLPRDTVNRRRGSICRHKCPACRRTVQEDQRRPSHTLVRDRSRGPQHVPRRPHPAAASDISTSVVPAHAVGLIRVSRRSAAPGRRGAGRGSLTPTMTSQWQAWSRLLVRLR